MADPNYLTPEYEEQRRNIVAFLHHKEGWPGIITSDEFAARLIEQQQAEIERLQAIVDDLPHFADGTVAHAGDDAWYPGERDSGTVVDEGWMVSSDDWGAETCECYPTKEDAAEAAKQAGSPTP